MTMPARTMVRRRVDVEAIRRITEVGDFIVPFAIRVVCDLGVADHLADGPRSIDDLARATQSHAPSLYRVLRTLASRGIFEEVAPEQFALTPMAEFLLSAHPLSLRDAYPLLRADLEAWARADHAVQTGESAFELVHGGSYYDYLAAHPDYSRRVDRSVRAVNLLTGRSVIQARDWSDVGTLVDVGGGDGAFLALMLARYPAMRGTLFDRPHVVAQAPELLRRFSVEDRCTVVGGSFFEELPAGADAYLLKTILHDWPDDRALRLLRNVRTTGGRLFVVEAIIPPGDAFDVAKLMDVHSLVLTQGPDRSRDRLDALLAAAGFAVTQTYPTTHAFTVIEAHPV